MTMTDPISDMLARIRNAQHVKHKQVTVLYSKIAHRILDVLADEGYIRGVTVQKNSKGFNELVVDIKYFDNVGVITKIKRISTPGRRVYSSIKNLPLIANGLGINILSTNKGVLSDVDARRHSVGGEVLCSVF